MCLNRFTKVEVKYMFKRCDDRVVTGSLLVAGGENTGDKGEVSEVTGAEC
jgi:hypothetical protein